MSTYTQRTAANAAIYGQIFESLTSGVIAVDKDGAIVMANPAASQHLRIPFEALQIGARFDALPSSAPFLAVMEEMRLTQQPISRRELLLEEADGEEKTIGVTASLLRGPDEFNGVAFLFIDLTELHALRRAAELNRQLAQIGELTAGVVHELRNPLSVVSGMAELLMRKLGKPHSEYAKASAIFDEASHLDKLISQFLSFARPYEVELGRCAPEELLLRAMTLNERLAEERNVRLVSHVDAEPPYMEADCVKLGLALGNIIRNALEATPQGGKVTVNLSESGKDLLYRVEDTGSGIHVKPGEDLFTAFLTKKEGGTGLGLAIVHRVVTAHHGSVSYGNRDEGGAWFEMRLPKEQAGRHPVMPHPE